MNIEDISITKYKIYSYKEINHIFYNWISSPKSYMLNNYIKQYNNIYISLQDIIHIYKCIYDNLYHIDQCFLFIYSDMKYKYFSEKDLVCIIHDWYINLKEKILNREESIGNILEYIMTYFTGNYYNDLEEFDKRYDFIQICVYFISIAYKLPCTNISLNTSF